MKSRFSNDSARKSLFLLGLNNPFFAWKPANLTGFRSPI